MKLWNLIVPPLQVCFISWYSPRFFGFCNLILLVFLVHIHSGCWNRRLCSLLLSVIPESSKTHSKGVFVTLTIYPRYHPKNLWLWSDLFTTNSPPPLQWWVEGSLNAQMLVLSRSTHCITVKLCNRHKRRHCSTTQLYMTLFNLGLKKKNVLMWNRLSFIGYSLSGKISYYILVAKVATWKVESL